MGKMHPQKIVLLLTSLLLMSMITVGHAGQRAASIIIQPSSATYQELLAKDKNITGRAERLKHPTVYFAFNQAKIEGNNKAVIATQARYLREHPDAKVRIEGHTDARGTHAYNQKLGKLRALTTEVALLAQGVDAAQITAVSYAETESVVQAKTEQDYALNRGASMVIYSLAATSALRWFIELGGGLEMPQFAGSTQAPTASFQGTDYKFYAANKQTAVPLLSFAAGPVFSRQRFWLPAFRFGLEYTHTFASRVEGHADGASFNRDKPYTFQFAYRYKANRDTLMDFAKVDIFDLHGLMPYALVGIGLSWNHFCDFNDTISTSYPAASLRFSNATTANFAYALGAGLDYKISSHWRSSVEYRYGDYGDLVSGYSSELGHGSQRLKRHYTSNQVRFHIRYIF